jgi:hypothetical protein
MNIIRMAQEAGFVDGIVDIIGFDGFANFAALVAAAERNKLAQWMVSLGYATGHGDTIEDLLEELEWQVTESWSKVVVASVEAEREACAQIAFNAKTYIEAAAAIRARGEK